MSRKHLRHTHTHFWLVGQSWPRTRLGQRVLSKSRDGTSAASVDIINVTAFFLGSSLCLSTSACLVDSSSWAFRARISASFSASSATTSSPIAPGGVGAGGDSGVEASPMPRLQHRGCRCLGGMLPVQYGEESSGWETPRLVPLLSRGQVATAASPPHPLPPVRWLQRRCCRVGYE